MNRIEKITLVIIITLLVLISTGGVYAQDFYDDDPVLVSFGINGNMNVISHSIIPTFEGRIGFLTGEFGTSEIDYMNILTYHEYKDYSDFYYMFWSVGILPKVIGFTLKPEDTPIFTLLGLNFNIGMKFSYARIIHNSSNVVNDVDVEILSLKFPIEIELLLLYVAGGHISLSPTLIVINNRIGFALYSEVGFRIVLGG
jgi:hypothetical protein